MKRLLLLMGAETYRAPDFIAAARRLNLAVAIGSDGPSGATALAPGDNLVLPFHDADAAVAAIEAAHGRSPFDAVLSVDDTALVLAARAGEALGLPGNPAEAAVAASNKAVLRDILKAAGLPGPWFREVEIGADAESLARRVSYPCVLKPLFLSASRGVIRADGPEQFVAAFRRIANILAEPEVARRGAELAGRLLIEGFIPGPEVSLEGMLAQGEFHLLAWFDKPDPLDGPFFEETLFVTPSRHPAAVQKAAVAAAGAATRALGLRTGPVHVELRLSPSPAGPGPVVVEVAARSIGGHCSRSLVFGAGMSLEELILRQAAGLAPGVAEREGRASGVMMLPIPRAGILRAVHGADAARAVAGIESLEIGIPPGQPVVPLPEGHRYLGFLFAKGGAPAEVEAALRRAHACLRFEIEGDS